MEKDNYRIVALLLLLLGGAQHASGASFDCTKATSVDEKLVCSNEMLSLLDEELGRTYKAARNYAFYDSDKSILVEQQREWVALRRKCESVACIEAFTRERINWLQSFSETVIGNIGEAYWERGIHGGLQQSLPEPVPASRNVVAVEGHAYPAPDIHDISSWGSLSSRSKLERHHDLNRAKEFAECAAFYKGVLIATAGQTKFSQEVVESVKAKRWAHLALSGLHSDVEYGIELENKYAGHDHMASTRLAAADPSGTARRCANLVSRFTLRPDGNELLNFAIRELNEHLDQVDMLIERELRRGGME